MAAKRILMLVGDFVEDYEVMVPFQVLAAAGVLSGRACSCYPAVGPDVRAAGGEYVDIPVDQAHVEGNLVTAPAWPAHSPWLARFLEALGTRIEL